MENFVKLAQICSTIKKTINPQNQPETEFWHYSIPEFDSNHMPQKVKGIEVQSNKLILNRPCILFSRLNPRIKRVWDLTTHQLNEYCIGSTEWVPFVIEDRSILEPRYLFWFLNSDRFVSLARSGVKAATKSRERVTKEQLFDVSLSLPPLSVQRRIAAIIDQADALRQKRRQALAALDRLTQSVFLDMFGDPVRNPKGWKITTLGNVLETIDSGWSPKCSENPANPDKWGILKLSAITSCEYNDSENKELPEGFIPRPEIEVKQGDVLFSRKNTYELVAACAYVHETRAKLMLSDLIFRLRIKSDAKILPIFLWQNLLHPGQRKQIQVLATGAAGSMPNISKAKLKEVSIILPPSEIQAEFAEKINKIRQMRQQMQIASKNIDTLFHSLQQRAFRGELQEG